MNSASVIKKATEEIKEKFETMARLEVEVVELKKKEALAKKKAIEEFKSSDDFQETVVTLASNYFGEGFDFCKRQLAYHHPNLGIDLDSMEMDHALFEKKEAEAEEREENEKNEIGDKGDTNLISP